MPKLKLVAKVRRTGKRPFTTYYYDEVGRSEESHVTQGHSASEKGAIRGAVVRVFMQEHKMARVYMDGALIYTIKPGVDGIRIHYGRAEELEAMKAS